MITLELNSKIEISLTCVYIPAKAANNQNLTKLQEFLDILWLIQDHIKYYAEKRTVWDAQKSEINLEA